MLKLKINKMITQLIGRLVEKTPTKVVIDCNGVGYIEGAMEATAELAIKLSSKFESETNCISKYQSGPFTSQSISKSG